MTYAPMTPDTHLLLYGEGSLADLACSLLSLAGGRRRAECAGPDAGDGAFLPSYLDGLGWTAARPPARPPFLSELAGTGSPLTADSPLPGDHPDPRWAPFLVPVCTGCWATMCRCRADCSCSTPGACAGKADRSPGGSPSDDLLTGPSAGLCAYSFAASALQLTGILGFLILFPIRPVLTSLGSLSSQAANRPG